MSRKFAALRKAAREGKNNATETARLAFQSIALKPEGDAIKEWLAMIVCDTSMPETEGAWREQHARRSFAELMINMMDGGEHEPGKDD